MEMMPITLQKGNKWSGDSRNAQAVYLIWLTVGISARRSASTASGRQASKRDAPNARSVSVLSWFSLRQSAESATRSAEGLTRGRTAHSSSFRMKLCKTKRPPTAFPHSMPTMGTMCHHTHATIQMGAEA
jgi:hypothetical protein